MTKIAVSRSEGWLKGGLNRRHPDLLHATRMRRMLRGNVEGLHCKPPTLLHLSVVECFAVGYCYYVLGYLH